MGEAGASKSAGADVGISLGSGKARVWGMSGTERLHRIFQRAGMATVSRDALASQPAGRNVLLARGDWVYDEDLIRALAQRPGVLLVGPQGERLAAHVPAEEVAATAAALETGQVSAGAITRLQQLDPSELAYNEALRKRETPVLEPLSDTNVRQVEARLFQGSYKGVTDIVTKYLWPRPARIFTRWCAQAGVTPNQVTFAGLLLVIAAFALFWTGHFGWGLVCAWIMTFLDTVDGKLARVTLTSSKFGNILDHGIDLIHPPFWWWAWLVGVQQSVHPAPHPTLLLAVMVGGYVAQRLEEGVFIKLFGIHMHAWRPFDSWFRLITARRNPNLILLTAAALAGRPDVGVVAVALWTAVCLLVHLVQILQAMVAPRGTVTSWLAR